MKSNVFIIIVIFFGILIYGCNEDPLTGPENSVNEDPLSKIQPSVTVTSVLDLNKSTLPEFPPAAPGDSPEGIAIDKMGNMYISNTRGPNRTINEVLRVNSNGTSNVFATLPGQGHATGLVTDKKGNVYVAFYTYGDLSRNGVYKIDPSGNLQRLRGSANIARPNALTFDALGNLYVTSSYGEESELKGAIWRFGNNKVFERWFMDPVLDGGPHPVAGVLPGANGIVFYPPNKLYVANTSQSIISCIEIGNNGQSSGVKWSVGDFLLMNIDGIAVDLHENIYGVLPASTISNLPPGSGPPPLPPVVMLNTKTFKVIPVVEIKDAEHFNTPTSVAIGKGALWGRNSLYVANAGLFYGQSHEPWANPGVVKVSISKGG